MLARNVLIFHSGALGDFILSWPFALALGRIYPQSRIIYVTHGQKGALAEKVLRLDSSDIEAGWHALYASDQPLSGKSANLLAGAHAVYAFAAPTPHWTANIQKLNPQAKIVTLEPLPPDAPEAITGHAVQWIVDQLKNNPIERSATQQIIRSIADRGIAFNRIAGSDIVIHPGSGSPTKCWPLENFLQLAVRLRAAGRTVKLLVGEVEQERWSPKLFDAMSKVAELRHPQTYLELLAELSTASVFIGNDSGPGHLAGIIGIPTVSIFGSTDPIRWKPLGPNVRVVQGKSLASVTVQDVTDAIRT